MTRFLLVRHGETTWNLDGRIQGQGDSPLSPAGVAQADALARRLAGENADLLVSSDLGRTMQTAEPLARMSGLPLRAMAEFRERSFGIFEGLTLPEIAARYPDEHERWRSRDPAYAMPGGESLGRLRERVESALIDIARGGARRVIVVTHGGVLDMIYRFVRGVSLEARRDWELLNASINTVSRSGEAWALEHWGDVAHLEIARDDTD